MDISKIRGLVFTSPANGEEFGTIRSLEEDDTNEYLLKIDLVPFAYDDCGNYFCMSRQGHVVWWDHETDEISDLAPSFAEFCNHCSEGTEVELREDQIIGDGWIDPEFAKELGISVPPDGWIRKNNDPN